MSRLLVYLGISEVKYVELRQRCGSARVVTLAYHLCISIKVTRDSFFTCTRLLTKVAALHDLVVLVRLN
jgi:hypothetical protein